MPSSFSGYLQKSQKSPLCATAENSKCTIFLETRVALLIRHGLAVGDLTISFLNEYSAKAVVHLSNPRMQGFFDLVLQAAFTSLSFGCCAELGPIKEQINPSHPSPENCQKFPLSLSQNIVKISLLSKENDFSFETLE